MHLQSLVIIASGQTRIVEMVSVRRFGVAGQTRGYDSGRQVERDMTKGEKAVARRYLISGRVQGVGFRFFAEEHAQRLALRGYVKNLGDGRVEVYAIGDEPRLEELKHLLAQGPRSGRVTSIEEFDEPVNSRYHSFVIEGGW